MKYIYLISIHLLISCYTYGQTTRDNIMFQAMEDEMLRNMEISMPDMDKPFFIAYNTNVFNLITIEATLGAVTKSEVVLDRVLAAARMLLGDYKMTNDSQYNSLNLVADIPTSMDYDHLRRAFWLLSDFAYKYTTQELPVKESYLKSNPKNEKESELLDFEPIEPIEKIIESNPEPSIELIELENMARELSAIFKDYIHIHDSKVLVNEFKSNIYKLTSEGTKIKQPINFIQVNVIGSVMTDDGHYFTDDVAFISLDFEGLTTLSVMRKGVKNLAENLMMAKSSPTFDEYYSGPVMFEGISCAEILIKNLLAPGQLVAIRKPDNRVSKIPPTMEDRLGSKIIDERITIKNYTSLPDYKKEKLFGYYEIDAEGVVPEKEMTLVENGYFKMMLNRRYPTLAAPKTTGSARFSVAANSIAEFVSWGTIHIQANNTTKDKEMKKQLMKLAQKKGNKFAYIVRNANTSSNSKVYRIDVKDGSETLVRFADIQNVDLSKLMNNMINISDKENVINHLMNSIPVSTISPNSVIIDDVIIKKLEVKKEKKPVVTFPLER